MSRNTGRRLALSPPRRFITDLISFAQRVPLCTLERTMHLAELADVRRETPEPPGWCALFTKAYAIVAARRPELRRAYLAWPWPCLYEHPENVASIAIERRVGTENAVLFGHVRTPEKQSLTDLAGHLRRWKVEPVESIGLFRRILKLSRLPGPLRRLVWWYGLNVSGARRARHLGTFGVSAVANLGASSVHLLTPVATAINYTPLRSDDSLTVRLTYDHRVLDGGDGARVLAEVEEALRGELREEVRGLIEQRDPDGHQRPGPEEWAEPVSRST